VFVHPEPVDRHPVDGPFLRIEVGRTHRELSAFDSRMSFGIGSAHGDRRRHGRHRLEEVGPLVVDHDEGGGVADLERPDALGSLVERRPRHLHAGGAGQVGGTGMAEGSSGPSWPPTASRPCSSAFPRTLWASALCQIHSSPAAACLWERSSSSQGTVSAMDGRRDISVSMSAGRRTLMDVFRW
jgi:hypothetical protein